MKDPFPFPPIPALSRAVEPLAKAANLPTLPLHIHEVLASFLLYTAITFIASPMLSARYFGKYYNSMSRVKKLNWDVHVVSLVQSVLINVLALWVMAVDKERKTMDVQERVWGYTGAAGLIQAFATGYFLWDLFITALYVDVFGPGMLAHAVSALLVYSFGFRPFLNYYGCVFILWELSSPFLNIHWFFDKVGMTGSRAQLYNGLTLIATFFSCRLVWGTYQSSRVYRDVWAVLNTHPSLNSTTASASPSSEDVMRFATESSTVPLWLAAVYLGSNLTLNTLNFHWFLKMIQAVQKRFTPSSSGSTESGQALKIAIDGNTTTATDGGSTFTSQPADSALRMRNQLIDADDAPAAI